MTTTTEINPDSVTINSGTWQVWNGSSYVSVAAGLASLYDADGNNTYMDALGTGIITFGFQNASVSSGEIIDGVAAYTNGNSGNNADSYLKEATLGAVEYPSNYPSGAWIGNYGPGHVNGAYTGQGWNSYINTLTVEIQTTGTNSWRTIKLRYIKYARPTITMTAPTEASTISNTARPTITWTFTGDTRPQWSYQVRVFTAAQYGIGGFDPATSPATWDSGQVVSTATTVQVPINLTDGVTYRAYMRASQALPSSGYVHWHTEGGVAWPHKTFTIDLAQPPVPTAIEPVSGSTVNNNVPVLKMLLGTPTISGALYRGEWQLATDAGFTANVKLITDPEAEARGTSVVTSEALVEATKLHQAVWYIRGRELDNFGQTGAWSSAHTFTVSHAPGLPTPLAPKDDSILAVETDNKVDLVWQFNDTALPYDGQSAFQVKVYYDNGSANYDSGKQISTANTFEITIPDIEEGYEFNWEVRVYDQDDVVSGWSSNVSGTHNVIYVERPTAVITFPTTTVEEPSPTITWTQEGSEFFGIPDFMQVNRYRLTIYRGDVLPENFVWTSGILPIRDNPSSTVESETFFSLAGQYAFQNDTTYNIVLEVRNYNGVWSLPVVEEILAEWDAPDKPTESASPTVYAEDGYVSVSWSNAVEDGLFASYGVYRRETGETEWTLIAEVTEPDSNYLVRDYLAGSGLDLDYSVVQRAERFGVIVESDYEPFDSTTVPTSDYWLVHPTDPDLSVRLLSVRDESFTEEYETATHNVIGVGRRVEHGTRWGFTGTLEAQLYDVAGMTARQQRQLIERIKAGQTHLYLRNPFGDVLKVAVGDISTNRIPGVGQNEYVTMTLPYQEVG